MKRKACNFLTIALFLAAQNVGAVTFFFSTGNPDAAMAMASRPAWGASTAEIEAADDFFPSIPVSITGVTFDGIIQPGAIPSRVDLSVYRIFPLDSDTGRTPQVPTRMNSPADNEFVTRSSWDGSLGFTMQLISPTASAANSAVNNLHVNAGGEGPVTGSHVRFNVTLNDAIHLAAGHYFLVPQVEMGSGNFLWLSAPKPIVSPGTPFTPDLQTWMRNDDLDPDWLRVGTDIVGGTTAPTFNGTFSVTGEAFSTGAPDGKMAMASRPPNSDAEIEAADDFLFNQHVALLGMSFTGLMPPDSTIDSVDIEIYRRFPADSDTGRTIHVPTRVNSPADNAFSSRSSVDGGLWYLKKVLATNFTAANSVLNGINPSPNQTTGGEGPVTGAEVEFDVKFGFPVLLAPDQYFIVPQVKLNTGNFYWLSAPKPIVPPGTPFSQDLQAWIRNSDLDPDWLKVGGDIVGGTNAFNASFTLDAKVVSPLKLGPAHLFLGLRNSDDVGAAFDVKVEFQKNDSTIAEGLQRCIRGLTRNPSLAKEVVIPFGSIPDTFFEVGDVAGLKVSVRIGTNPDDSKCSGPGASHRSGTARLWYDSVQQPSHFGVTLPPFPGADLFLRSDGNPCVNAPTTGVTTDFLDATPPDATKPKCVDSGPLTFAGGNLYKPIHVFSFRPLP